MFGPTHAGKLSVVGGEGWFLTERYSDATVLLLFGLIQKEAKRSGTSNRPARGASAPPWMFGPTHVGTRSVFGDERRFFAFLVWMATGAI